MITKPIVKPPVNAAMDCAATAWALTYHAMVRTPYAKPAPTRKDK